MFISYLSKKRTKEGHPRFVSTSACFASAR